MLATCSSVRIVIRTAKYTATAIVMATVVRIEFARYWAKSNEGASNASMKRIFQSGGCIFGAYLLGKKARATGMVVRNQSSNFCDPKYRAAARPTMMPTGAICMIVQTDID